MATKQQSALPPLPPPRSVIASKVPLSDSLSKIIIDLQQNYLGVEKVSRHHGNDQEPLAAVRIDFRSEKFAKEVLDKGYVLIDGQRRPVRPYWPPVCPRCHNEGHRPSECPHKPLTEQRLAELFAQQQAQVVSMIEAFESKWNARLSSINAAAPTTNTNADQLVPIFRELTSVCQQFTQQNMQLQQQLSGVVSRMRDTQMHPSLPIPQWPLKAN